MKRAVREVTHRMHKEGVTGNSERKDDQLGWSLAFIRAVEEVNLRKMSTCARAYTQILAFVNPENPNARSCSGMAKLREHALDLARGAIWDEVEDLKQLNIEPNSPSYRQRKSTS